MEQIVPNLVRGILKQIVPKLVRGIKVQVESNRVLGQGHFGMNIELLIPFRYAFRLFLCILYFFVLFSCLVIFDTIFLSQCSATLTM